jgi:hypothetical protein
MASAPPPLRRNRDFMLLWSGQALSGLGSQVSLVAYPLLVLADSCSSTSPNGERCASSSRASSSASGRA